MKCIAALLLLGLAAGLVAPLAADGPKREEKSRFKGVELYSWKDGKKGWQFALLDGTNRQKTEMQVKSAATVYSGADKLIEALKLLAVGEQVSWSHPIPGFDFPPREDVKKIEAAAKAAKVELNRGGR